MHRPSPPTPHHLQPAGGQPTDTTLTQTQGRQVPDHRSGDFKNLCAPGPLGREPVSWDVGVVGSLQRGVALAAPVLSPLPGQKV